MSWHLSVNLQHIQPLPRLRLLCSLLLPFADGERCANTLQHLWRAAVVIHLRTIHMVIGGPPFAEDCDFITTVETCIFVVVFFYLRGLVQSRTKENKEQKKNKKPKTLVTNLRCSCNPSVMCRINVSPAVQTCSWTHKSVCVFSTTRTNHQCERVSAPKLT